MGDSVEVTEEEIEKSRNAPVFCFVDDDEIQGFDRAYMMMMLELHKHQINMYMNEDNILRCSHGTKYIRSARENNEGAQKLKLSAEWSISRQSIVNNDLSLIENNLRNAVESLSAQFERFFYSAADAAVQRVGNVISVEEAGSIPRSFLKMLKKIELTVDRNGNVSLPQIHAGPDMMDKLLNELKSQPPEFWEQVDRVLAEKRELALQRETERKAKFRGPI